MANTSATHSFLFEKMVKSLDITMAHSATRVKSVNFPIRKVLEVARNMLVDHGKWGIERDLSVISLEDFNIIFSFIFLVVAKVRGISFLSGMLIRNAKEPYFFEGFM